MYDIIIIGGGLAGLISSFRLSFWGYNVLLIEKQSYPLHRVCGEYISNEVKDFMEMHQLLPNIELPQINELTVSSPNGNQFHMPLGLGGFGISRFTIDQYLFEKSKQAGTTVLQNTKVHHFDFDGSFFTVNTTKGESFQAPLLIGAFGKRSLLDKQMKRPFIQSKSPYIGIKYHIKNPIPTNQIALHNFKDGYCGISKVEEGKTNLCYLSSRQNLKKFGSIEKMEQEVLFENPHIRQIFEESEFLFEKPIVINEISFSAKSCIEQHVMMAGDSAGLITPLCGNGMAMAIHSAIILTDLIGIYFKKGEKVNREQLENAYQQKWQQAFAFRLNAGRQLQKLFGSKKLTNHTVNILKHLPTVSKWLVSLTHGKPITYAKAPLQQKNRQPSQEGHL
ncbi:FAD-dependent monooxygenase [Limibacter armeniacum]|uniref:NAD(P)/FAD-dependent oxidoreductase n=1 Tax=Limibacter armeniacum TaxID=466084 RepID=UPI002FE6652B